MPCSPVEANFLLSLFLAPHEYIFLSSAPGTTVPVTLSLAKTSSRSQVVDLSAPSGHNRGS